jgi:outer membrane protein TolC
LLRRRPDVRAAELLALAQSAQIGVAEADLYPAISITGTFGGAALPV